MAGAIRKNPASASTIYAAFMEEIKQRLDEVGFRLQLINSEPSSPTRIYEAEFCYLQIRFVCELLALASLVANHSMGLTKELLKSWNAEQIFSRLERINPNCFPVAIEQTVKANGVVHFVPTAGRFMRIGDLKTVYSQCGSALHRGALRHALQGEQKTYDPGQLKFWQSEFTKLLLQHMVLMLPDDRVLLVNIQGGPNGEVAVYEAVADLPGKMPNNPIRGEYRR